MRHLKRFNEELEPSTYTKASKKLREMGHSNRAAQLDSWSIKRRQDEENKAIQRMKDALSQTPSFRMKFFRDRWNNGRVLATEPYFEGNFYLDLLYESDWMYDSEDFLEYELDDKNQIQFPFSVGLMPADEETQEKFNGQEFEYVWRNMIWPIYLYIRLNDSKTTVKEGNSKVFWEEREDGTILFADRREAMKFKRFLFESINSDNKFGKQFKEVDAQIKRMIDSFESKDRYYWQRAPMKNGQVDMERIPARDIEGNVIEIVDGSDIGIKYGQDKYYWYFGNKESNLKQIDMKQFENAIRKMSINSLYRD